MRPEMIEQMDRYQILEELGRGGFATVYRARDTELGRLVALKELHPHLLADIGWTERFRHEARLIARLNHPRIVTLYDIIGQAPNRLFLVMQLVEGASLDKLLADQGQFPWVEALEIIEAIADGVDYAHRQNILHRDLKPANILMDPGHGPLLSDFGLAKLINDHSSSQSGSVVGTSHYMPPEIWDGEPATPQTDIYALGCIFYELLTGQRLFGGDTQAAIMMAHFQPLVLPKQWPEGVPLGVAEVLNVALAKQPKERYATAMEMVNTLMLNLPSLVPLSSNIIEAVSGDKKVLQEPVYTNEKPLSPLFPADIQEQCKFTPLPLLSPAEERTRADLTILLKNVETSWIKGVLEKSVHHMVLLDLGKDVRAEVVEHPWETVIGRPAQADQPLPAGTKISAIFEDMPLLLILGEPGSGKTITLLELARDLITKVKADLTFVYPVPVIFNLSTWTNKQQPLNDWLIEELRSKYQTPRQLGRVWLEQRRILPLLDGLDEVKRETQAACLEAINQFAVDYGLQGLVVCSRLKEYLQLPVRLKFYGAVYLRPLDDWQIDQYLARTSDKLKSLSKLLQEDKLLQELARTPLILSIMSLTYQETSVENLTSQRFYTVETHRKALFDAYIQQMFKRRGKTQHYDDKQTQEWLCWLARKMSQHNQELFLIEGLQPSWLQRRSWRWTYTFASRLMCGLIFGLIGGLIGELTGSLIGGLIGGLTGGLIVGLIVGFIDVFRFEWLGKWREVETISTFLWSVTNIVAAGLIFGLIFGLISSLIFGLIGELTGSLISMLIIGLFFGLIFGLRGSRQSLTNDIQTVEALHWSWHTTLKHGLIFGLIFGLIVWLIVGLSWGRFIGLYDGLYSALSWGLSFGLSFGLIGGIFNGVSHKIIETKTTPNQGIWLSTRNAIFGGLIVGLSFGLIFGLVSGPRSGLAQGLNYGILGVLWYGGLDVIQHYTLRLILILQGHTPRDYARFLDYTVERIFLQKVGGGYRFIHRLLLEHFAAMGQDEVKNNQDP